MTFSEVLGGKKNGVRVSPSPVAQLVRNPPATRETWVPSLGWGRERLPTPVFWPGKFHGLFHGVAKSWTRLSDLHFTFMCPRSRDCSQKTTFKSWMWQKTNWCLLGRSGSQSLAVLHSWHFLASSHWLRLGMTSATLFAFCRDSCQPP